MTVTAVRDRARPDEADVATVTTVTTVTNVTESRPGEADAKRTSSDYYAKEFPLMIGLWRKVSAHDCA